MSAIPRKCEFENRNTEPKISTTRDVTDIRKNIESIKPSKPWTGKIRLRTNESTIYQYKNSEAENAKAVECEIACANGVKKHKADTA